MPDLSPLSGDERKSDFGDVRAAVCQSGLNLSTTRNFENAIYGVASIIGAFVVMGPWVFIALRQMGYV